MLEIINTNPITNVEVSCDTAKVEIKLGNQTNVDVELQVFPTMTSSNILNVKRFNPSLPITPSNYQIITLDGSINSGNVQLPTNPVNGETYTFNYLTGPNSINIVFSPKSIVQNGFTQLPIAPNSATFLLEIYFDSQYDLWRLKYSSNN